MKLLGVNSQYSEQLADKRQLTANAIDLATDLSLTGTFFGKGTRKCLSAPPSAMQQFYTESCQSSTCD